jgi:hypothetical protein
VGKSPSFQEKPQLTGGNDFLPTESPFINHKTPFLNPGPPDGQMKPGIENQRDKMESAPKNTRHSVEAITISRNAC